MTFKRTKSLLSIFTNHYVNESYIIITDNINKIMCIQREQYSMCVLSLCRPPSKKFQQVFEWGQDSFPVGLNWWGEGVPYSRTCGKSNTISKSQLSAVMTSSSQVLILVYTNIHSKYLFLFTFGWIGEVSIFNTLSYIVWEQLTSD